MPYASRRQARWAHATRQPFARHWDKETPSLAALPEKKDASVEAGAPLHGPGGLLATPGMRKWGKRRPSVATKPMTPSEVGRLGALARWGKYTPRPDAPVARGISLSRQPKPSRQPAPKPPRAARRAGSKKGRAAAKPKKTEQQRQEEQQAKRTQHEQERQAQREANRKQVYGQMGIAPDGRVALEALRRGDQPDAAAIARGGFVDAGLVEQAADGSYRMTPAGRALTAAAESGDAGRAGDTISGARDRLGARRARQAAAEERKRATAARRADRSSGRGGGGGRKPKRAALRHSTAAQRRLERTRKRLADAIERARRRSAEKSFTVFKDARGDYRWVMRTTTAYRDRDGEILTTAGLERDAARMTATGQHGPLRYWHIGQPDPFDPVAPWGPGLDIGDCDYSIVIGRTSIESGTFKSQAIGQAFAESADDYEASPGFFHPYGPHGPPGGAYEDFRRFERSTVPVMFGRASNLFTGMTVKEARMDEATYKARVDAFLKDMQSKGVPPEVAAATLGQMQQADKSAQQQGIAFKSEEAPAVPTVDADPWQAVVAALKAALQPAEKAEAPAVAVETQADNDMPMGGITESGDGEPGEYIGDMTPAEFWTQLKQYLTELLAPQAKMAEMAKAMASGLGELKSLYTTKDAGTIARIAQLETELAALKGDQPLVVENEALAALKSKGPQAPPDASAPQIPDDPNRPFAAATAALLPHLYGAPVQGYNGAAGWQIGQQQQPPMNTGGN